MLDQELDQFVADVFDVIVQTGVWQTVLSELQRRGYTEEEVDEGFTDVAVRAGRVA